MRILFASMPHPTHFHPMVPLAWALRAAGHEVRIAGHPELAGTATGAGLTAVPIGPPAWFRDDPAQPELYRQLVEARASNFLRSFDFAGSPDGVWPWHDLLGLEKMLVAVLLAGISSDPVIDELVAYARHWHPDLIIWEQLTVAGAVAAEILGIPHGRFLYGLDFLGRARQEFRRLHDAQPPAHREDPSREWLEDTMSRLGGRWTERLRTGGFTIDTAVPGTRLDVATRSVSMRYVPYNGASVVPGWLREPARRRRVCVTLGLSGEMAGGGTTVAEILAGLGDLDVEVVATVGADQVAGADLPANVRLVDFVPLHDLMPTCAAIVHHGGIGSRMTAAYHGVPQLVLGHGFDTLLVGRRQEELGAGLCIPAGEATGETVRAGVVRLLDDPGIATGAAKLRSDLLMEPSPADVVAILENLVRTGEAAGR